MGKRDIEVLIIVERREGEIERGGREGFTKYLPSFQSVVRFAMFHEGRRALSQSIIVALVDTWVPVYIP